VITTTNAPWAGLKDRGCGWWIPLQEKHLASTLSNAMALPQAELRAMGERGRRWVQEDFSPEQVAEQMREVYLWCAGRAGMPDGVHC
jgi:glycosyltransferase involved in cell wall biosynthesis